MISFAEKINWSMSSGELLINALTHKSYVTSDSDDVLGASLNHNERLIYLGELCKFMTIYKSCPQSIRMQGEIQ